MFLIRRIHDDLLPANQRAIEAVQRLLRERFPAARPEDADELPRKLRDPRMDHFTAVLYVAESRRSVVGFALVLREPRLDFWYLDYLAAGARGGGGVGGALYTRLREDARVLGAKGLFFECLPDDPAAYGPGVDPALVAESRARLRFYEQWGARPIAGTAYETPVRAGGRGAPHLCYDALGRREPLDGAYLRRVVRAILEGKYHYLCSPAYVRSIVASVASGPVALRPARYRKKQAPPPAGRGLEVPIVVNEGHDIHHVRERGYVEAPVRIGAILADLERSGMFRRVKPRGHGIGPITAVHDKDLVAYLERACAKLEPGKSIYPYVFPLRNAARPPKELGVRAGYYCIDTFTPLNANAFRAARGAVDCALTAADRLLEGERLAYALVRPPGHHAERRAYGGFCYLNNTAIAANYLSRQGKVALLDIDYHHGNGTQDIFYRRADVLTVSLHAHPSVAYPYFSGFADERGEGPGEGFNLDIPLPEEVDGRRYQASLRVALDRVAAFDPAFVVVALGLDTAKGDPTGTWSLTRADIEENGRLIAGLGRPTLVVQEGGYRTRTLGSNALAFFRGLTGEMRAS